jgi:sugar O-acyltransferase (sialic acid O-acetyltransferase NeuD family)
MRWAGLVGAGGFGREVMPLLRAALRRDPHPAQGAAAVFVETSPRQRVVNGLPVLSEAEFVARAGERWFAIAVGDGHAREAIAGRLIAAGLRPMPVVADSATVLDACEIGEGAILCGHATVTSNVRIGRFFHANLYAYVAHDCVIGDFVTFAPAVRCNGNVVVGDHAYVGTGAVLKQGTAARPLRIGRGAVVGMGAVVTRDVPDGVTVVGNPARPLVRAAVAG